MNAVATGLRTPIAACADVVDLRIRETFAQQGDFAAVRAAEAWCAERGISVGRMDRFDVRGLLYGRYDIAKWHNLTKRERAQCHGQMRGDMRHGPVTVSIIPRERAVAP